MQDSVSLIQGRKFAPQDLGNVVVLGLGKSGKAVSLYLARLLGERVKTLTIYGGVSNPDVLAWAQDVKALGAEIFFDTEDVDGDFDLCLVSPGIPETSDFYQNGKAHARELIGEVEFAWRESRAASKWVAVTGTNGKTTTTSLIAHELIAAGLPAAAVGNIGDPCIDAVASDQINYYVLECSSYQLASTVQFDPDVALLISLTPDHISWHGSLGRYYQTKLELFKPKDQSASANRASQWSIFNLADPQIVKELSTFGTIDSSVFLIDPAAPTEEDLNKILAALDAPEVAAGQQIGDYLTLEMGGALHRICAASDLQLKGRHNVINALMAAAAAWVIGLTAEQIAQGLETFQALEHRIEPSGVVGDIQFYNDSKATNVDATLCALSAFEPARPIVLLGGRDKGTDLTPLVEACVASTKAVVCFGEAGDRFAEAFKDAPDLGDLKVFEADHLEDAFQVAVNFARPGDIVLLSPACASFDEFSCFEERGQVFKRLVNSYTP